MQTPRSLVGQPLKGLLPPDQFIPEITVTDPAGKTTKIEPTLLSSQNPLRGWEFDENWNSGIYHVDFGQPSLPRKLIAVNVDPQEGNLTPTDQKQMERELFKNPQLNLRVAPTVNNGEMTTLQDSPISRELLWLGLAFLAVEVALVWKFSAGFDRHAGSRDRRRSDASGSLDWASTLHRRGSAHRLPAVLHDSAAHIDSKSKKAVAVSIFSEAVISRGSG